ncbi:hypothetical protein [Metallibacterium scheffleri]
MENKSKASISVPMLDALLNLGVAVANTKQIDEPLLVLPKATEARLSQPGSALPRLKPVK